MSSATSSPGSDPENRAAEAEAVMVTFTGIATLLVAARVYTCSFIKQRRLYLEEWTILATVVIAWVAVACMFMSLRWGIGRHRQHLSQEQQVQAKFWYLVGTGPSLLAVSLPKISVVNLLCRLFKPAQWHRVLMWSLASTCLAQFVAVSLAVVFGCRPIAASWDYTINDAKCIASTAYVHYCYYAAAFSATLDLYFAVYPATQFTQLTCSLKKKISLSVMLGLGAIACAAASYKTSLLGLIANEDYTWTDVEPIMWTAIEAAVIVMAACVPTLHPLYEKIYGWLARHTITGSKITTAASSTQAAESHDSEPRKGYWTRRIDAITLNLSSSISSRMSTHASGRGATCIETSLQTRTLEDAATVTQPPEVIWHTNIVRSSSMLRVPQRPPRGERSVSFQDV